MELSNRLARDEWNLGVIRQTISDIVRNGITTPVSWFPRNSWRIFADPFCIVNADGSLTILAEMLNHWIGRGEIWSADIPAGGDPLGAKFVRNVSCPVHLSYPNFVQDGLSSYLTMESHEAGGLFLWRRDGNQWRYEKTLMPRPVVDPTIHYDGLRWWLFCTFANDRPDEYLHLFHADTLLGDWIAHPSNPIVADRARARPAGALFGVDGMLIRPSQDSSVTYGGRLVLNQIVTLTPQAFQEAPLRTINPDLDYYTDGIHTIAAAGDYTVIDGKRWHRGLGNLGRLLSAKVSKLYRTKAVADIPSHFQFRTGSDAGLIS